ncbi:beta-glucosidase [Georgenia satyanarayanai]|uniref:Exo-alpha-(1->6)-L-arabinopyranosidase n=1 Tax=Georgenia satyanarayanai TaxID=860221 RepID=A0A2Y9AAE0_9MICO|nr:beta-glucosidase [Georgenia satyanarayanai]SSA39237.1 beta-glucosidase [Georgenia satyanarayanai]
MTDTVPAQPDTLAPGAHQEPASARVRELLASMTLEEKLAQIVGLWVGAGADGEVVAPLQDAMLDEAPRFTEFARHGLGHLTRVFGTHPVEPSVGRRALLESQRWLVENTRLGIPAIAHEECLTGVAAWRAATFPTPLAWGAAFDPALVEEMAAAIGESMVALGVHQGLSPVLDVVRDARWGRVEECIGEDPYLVGTVGTAYVRGLQSTGIHATLKHLVGYSASRAGRNLAPVHAGPREIADVLLPPFEMAVRDGGARSVMHAYTEIDGVPVAADPEILTGLLREQWGFDGTVVADYFGVAFLHLLHGVAANPGHAAQLALAAGIDVELPTGNAYLAPLRERIEDGRTPVELVDRAVLRVLRQKEELGLLDADFSADAPADDIDLDPPHHRALAQRLAEESVVLLSNDGTLPLASPARVAVVGPNAHRVPALFGCYSFVNHVIPQHPGTEDGIPAPTVLEALRTEGVEAAYAAGCAVDDDDRSGIAEAVALAAEAEVAVVVVGDQSGLFGRGTVGEGCDRDDLELPGVQRELVEAVLATGTPVVLVLLTGRPYVIDWALERCAAVVQSFFPGEAGGAALAGVLTGRVNPSGRLPVSMPRSAGSQPYSYLHPALTGPSSTTNLDPTPALPFGHGLGYTTFTRSGLEVASPEVATDGSVEVSVRVRNTGERAGTDVVQLYGRDVVGTVTRPVAQLLGYCRVDLEPGEEATVHLTVPTTRLAFSDRRMVRVVEPGTVELWVGPSCAERETESSVELVGGVHEVRPQDPRLTRTEITR